GSAARQSCGPAGETSAATRRLRGTSATPGLSPTSDGDAAALIGSFQTERFVYHAALQNGDAHAAGWCGSVPVAKPTPRSSSPAWVDPSRRQHARLRARPVLLRNAAAGTAGPCHAVAADRPPRRAADRIAAPARHGCGA